MDLQEIIRDIRANRSLPSDDELRGLPYKKAFVYGRVSSQAQVKESRAEGVIFLYLKFCDPHAFDYPYIKTMLDDQGIPNLLLEIRNDHLSSGPGIEKWSGFLAEVLEQVERHL